MKTTFHDILYNALVGHKLIRYCGREYNKIIKDVSYPLGYENGDVDFRITLVDGTVLTAVEFNYNIEIE